jgi:hypothetical protein
MGLASGNIEEWYDAHDKKRQPSMLRGFLDRMEVTSQERPFVVKAIVDLFLEMRKRTLSTVAHQEANLVTSHRQDHKAQQRVEIVLRGSVADEEEGDANEVNECPQQVLRAVQANYGEADSLFERKGRHSR